MGAIILMAITTLGAPGSPNAPTLVPRNLQPQQLQARPNVAIPQIQHQVTDPAQFMSINVYPLPDIITVTVASATGAGAVATRVFIFNETAANMNNQVTNNGSGAASITYAYQDGFNGNVISSLLSQARGGVGAAIYGFSLRMVVTASRAGDPIGLGASNPYFAVNNAYGQPIPNNSNMTGDQTRSDFDTSIEVNPIFTNLPRFAQFSFIIPVGDTVTGTFYTTQNFKR